jgi:hypothetical protein
MGTPPEPSRASESSKGAVPVTRSWRSAIADLPAPRGGAGLFWSSVGISAVASVFAASKAHTSTTCRLWLIVGTGVQMVASLGLAYVIMGGGQPGFLPLLVASALMEMYFVRMSLAVNPLSASRVAIARRPLNKHLLIRGGRCGLVWFGCRSPSTSVLRGLANRGTCAVCAGMCVLLHTVKSTDAGIWARARRCGRQARASARCSTTARG